jgi:hypothetical protein
MVAEPQLFLQLTRVSLRCPVLKLVIWVAVVGWPGERSASLLLSPAASCPYRSGRRPWVEVTRPARSKRRCPRGSFESQQADLGEVQLLALLVRQLRSWPVWRQTPSLLAAWVKLQLPVLGPPVVAVCQC